jgi:hypothetical protein
LIAPAAPDVRDIVTVARTLNDEERALLERAILDTFEQLLDGIAPPVMPLRN